jgi:hypothetical protein
MNAATASAARVAVDFVQHINGHSPDRLKTMMTENHSFIDSTGRRFEGRETMGGGWAHYFSMFPDYEIVVESSIQDGNVVALFGTAKGTYAVKGEIRPENHWEIPVAIRAVIESGKVNEWRVYADNHIVFEIMSRNSG